MLDNKLMHLCLLAPPLTIAAVTGCAKSQESKTLPDLASFLQANGVRGPFTLENPTFVSGNLVIGPKDRQIAKGSYHDAVNNTVQTTWCSMTLFDTEAHAARFEAQAGEGDKTFGKFLAGCFVVTSPTDTGFNKTLETVLKQFTPYK